MAGIVKAGKKTVTKHKVIPCQAACRHRVARIYNPGKGQKGMAAKDGYTYACKLCGAVVDMDKSRAANAAESRRQANSMPNPHRNSWNGVLTPAR